MTVMDPRKLRRYHEAFRKRDRRYDGKFFVAVRTTRIYCRPICPARPKRENIEFYPTKRAAERAGYRACLRCRPETAPGSGAWLGQAALVRRGVRLMNEARAPEFSEPRLAERLGVSPRHLRRVFVKETGRTPRQLWLERRLELTRKLLSETKLEVSRIALQAGFRSIRRFNEAFKARYAKNPTQLRKKK